MNEWINTSIESLLQFGLEHVMSYRKMQSSEPTQSRQAKPEFNKAHKAALIFKSSLCTFAMDQL